VTSSDFIEVTEMVGRSAGHSDEPTRLHQVIVPTFADETDGLTASLVNGSAAQLMAGVLAQDDCAVFRLRGDQDVVVGSDYIRGSKFRLYELGYLNNFDIGYYLAMANFSDIAAMGALPIALLSVIRYPKTMNDGDFSAVVEGIRAGCAQVGARNVGGDIGTAERLILSASAIGVTEPGTALMRSGARPGDILCISGYTGIAGAAQRYYYDLDKDSRKLSSAVENRLISAWRRPQARVLPGRILSSSGMVTSCQDSSDGLKAAVESLASASKVGFTLQETGIPVDPVVEKVAQLRELDTMELIFGDSVDFQLVFTVSPDQISSLQKLLEAEDLSFFCIGEATNGRDLELRRSNGEAGALPGEGWKHTT
jgi:thiamine-monophosphate kinase